MTTAPPPPSLAPLRIAMLAYRGKPHVGGQGVYVREMSKALTDLGHHVEVFGGPLRTRTWTPGSSCTSSPASRSSTTTTPAAYPGFWEIKDDRRPRPRSARS